MRGRPETVPSVSPLTSLLMGTASAHRRAGALAWDQAIITYGELVEAADRLAGELAVSPGERVALVAPNSPALVCGLFAIWQAGAVAVPLAARLRRFELERAFADARPASVVVVERQSGFALAREVEAIASATATVRHTVVVDDLGQTVERLGYGERARATAADADIATVLYTSGTTGEPKGAQFSHRLCAAMARNMSELLQDDAEAPYGLVPPASHAFGLGCLLAGIAAGALAVMFDVSTSLQPLIGALDRHRARVLHGTPALFARLDRSAAELSLNTGLTAGAWCPPQLLESLDQAGITVLNLYGMTEIGAATSCRRADPPGVRYHTVGRPLGGYDVRTRESAGSTPGEIEVRSAFLTPSYLGRPWTEEELADGSWFRTGDLGQLDADGNLTIAGRAKEVVHVGGFNVFPAEVENFLLTHPSVAQAAVVGMPHPALGEALKAYVVPVAGADLAPRDVVRFARAGIAGYKVPYTVEVRGDLPLLPSGKPDRRALAGAEEGRREEALR